MAARKVIVYTYRASNWHPGDKPRPHMVLAYLDKYTWDESTGCVHTVEASSGPRAKLAAIKEHRRDCMLGHNGVPVAGCHCGVCEPEIREAHIILARRRGGWNGPSNSGSEGAGDQARVRSFHVRRWH